ncbi:homeobox protein Hox-A13-like [Rhopalosiphum padi]|uniref:homeobox protein Hox-A13-like n=1 Tax=Rhopalosiphum padi TaxID=40932 RepID=UPI00298E626F|nr:homeobox protein Hox-A13-like [Rhopalosiphum padi]
MSADSSGRYANHYAEHPLRSESIWQDHQRLQLQEQVNTWNRMMYRYWKLQQQQHLIPYYQNAWRSKEPLKIKKPRRKRFSFNEEQVGILEKAFQMNSFLGEADRRYLANQLGVTHKNVTYWFQNRRMRTISDSQLDIWCMNFRNQIAAKMKRMPSTIMRS